MIKSWKGWGVGVLKGKKKGHIKTNLEICKIILNGKNVLKSIYNPKIPKNV